MNCEAIAVPTSDPREPSGTGSRIVLIDFLRGLCLIVMTVDHLPETIIKKFTLQGFGFFSAAECFVFLSGLVAGRVYGRIAITPACYGSELCGERSSFTLPTLY